MVSERSFRIPESGVRLDAALLAAFPSSTRAFCRDAVANGMVTVNGRAARKGDKLRAGDEVHVKELLEADDNKVLPDRSVTLAELFADDALLAYDKPAGMPVQPLTRSETGTLMNGVVAHHPEVASVGDQPLMAGALHRIDAGTSGLVLVARTQQAFDGMRAQFAGQSVEKTYLAMVEGAVAVGGTLEHDLAHTPGLPFCKIGEWRAMRVTEAERARLKPLHAVTRYRPIGRSMLQNQELTLLEVTIFTGVTHQIRAQLALAGMHIVNDRLYGAFAVEGEVGHRLHALSAKFRHPVSGDETVIRTQLPSWAVAVFQV